MMNFFIEGGWVMWPLLVFGLILIGGALGYARDLERARLRFLAAMGALLSIVVLHGTVMNVAAVLFYVQDPRRVPDADLVRTLVIGLKESSRPALLGGGFLVLALAFVAIGSYRELQSILRQR